ncbi:hypothetical protein [Alkalihalobacillus sp. LMS39]|uniref:hypothetical protein n=1 Tax=Alkalihalobacillus sp. LMS39 TaxID=2924032 RepID=UPI001FB4D3CA|nr:hypothetical protein [Alkalihalobacillus sp. LMS39]UOE95095.1 hypothetical protein MM271_05570 [Alkalihalobacillus sp. LMS39]
MEKEFKNLEQFNLKEFIKFVLEYEEELMNPSVFSFKNISKVDDDEMVHYDVEQIMNDLIKGGKYVYVNFSSSRIDKEIDCIDGESYLFLEEDEVEDYFYDEESVPESFQPIKDLPIYEDSSAGYLLKYTNEVLIIQSAIVNIDSVEPLLDMEILDGPMDKFLRQFIVEE